MYNAGSELNATTGFYDLFYRNYDPALGRFFQVDPLAHIDHSVTSYAYAGDNPIRFNDPMGLYKVVHYDPLTGESIESGGYEVYGPLYVNRAPGSGNHWADGIRYSDWTPNGGSDMFRNAKSNGAVSLGGTQYVRDSQGNMKPVVEKNGQLGYYVDSWYYNEDGEFTVYAEWVSEDPFQMAGGPPSYTPPPKDGFPGFPDATPARRKGGRPRWKLPEGDIIEWDGQHGGELERYNPRGKHIGVWNPQGEMIKDPVPGRTIEPIVSPDPWYIPSAKTVERTLVWGTVAVGVGIIVFDIVTIPSGEGLIGVQMIGAALAR